MSNDFYDTIKLDNKELRMFYLKVVYKYYFLDFKAKSDKTFVQKIKQLKNGNGGNCDSK